MIGALLKKCGLAAWVNRDNSCIRKNKQGRDVCWQLTWKTRLAWKGEKPTGRPVVRAWSCQLHGRHPFGVETNDDGHRMLPMKLDGAWRKEERAGWSRMAGEICWSC